MPLNGTQLMENPFEVMMTPYTELFGIGAYLIIIVFIVGAIYIKTRDVMATAAALIIASMLFATAGIYNDFPQLVIISVVVVILAVIGLIISFMFQKGR